MNTLSREDIFALDDITTKELVIPDKIPVWGGKTVTIRQLTRGQQDAYLKRQFGDTRLKQDRSARNQEISRVNMYGHDAWICVKGLIDDDGEPLFKNKDIDKLNTKSGEAIGWIASEIIEFSEMGDDKDTAKKLEEDIKN